MPGPGVGGHCIAVDPWFIIHSAPDQARLMRSAREVNEYKPRWVMQKVKEKAARFKAPKVACLGLAFKPDSDDVREAPAIDIIEKLKEKGASVKAYDPKAMENMKAIHPDIAYAGNPREALQDSDACLIVTDWEEFKKLSDEDFKLMRDGIIIEGRKVLDKSRVSKFEGICW